MIKRILAGIVLALSVGSPVYATGGDNDQPKCAAYVYAGTATNLCDRFPGTGDVDCGQIGKPVEVVHIGIDPWLLDRDGDHKGCDQPGGTPSSSGSSSPSASPSASKSASASPSPSRSVNITPTVTHSETDPTAGPGVADGPSLPKTGPSLWALLPAGIAALGLGGVLIMAARRRRRNRFVA